jgi:16S rRNA (uracil1498-N3)-methyltransferase
MDSVHPQKLKDILRQRTDAKKIQIIIGPEGDFTEDEIQGALSAGAIPVSLGSNTLRTETAAIAGLAIVLYELFDYY